MKKKLDGQQAILMQLKDMNGNIMVLAEQVKQLATTTSKMEERLEAVESKPAKRWDAAVGAILTGVDALALLGVTLAVPYVGSVLTGVLVSRGASFVHDLWGKVNGQSNIDIQAPVDVHIEGMAVKEDDKPPDAV